MSNQQAEIIKKGVLGKHNLKESLSILRSANSSISPRLKDPSSGVKVLSKSSVKFKELKKEEEKVSQVLSVKEEEGEEMESAVDILSEKDLKPLEIIPEPIAQPDTNAAKRLQVFYEDSDEEEGEAEQEEQNGADMISDEDEEVKLPDFSKTLSPKDGAFLQKMSLAKEKLQLKQSSVYKSKEVKK